MPSRRDVRNFGVLLAAGLALLGCPPPDAPLRSLASFHLGCPRLELVLTDQSLLFFFDRVTRTRVDGCGKSALYVRDPQTDEWKLSAASCASLPPPSERPLTD